jgi:hypothetical protein
METEGILSRLSVSGTNRRIGSFFLLIYVFMLCHKQS